MFLLLVSFPDGLIPGETFIEPIIFDTLESASIQAKEYIEEEGASLTVIYRREGNRLERVD